MAVHGSFCTERFQALYGLLQKELWLHRGGSPGARLRPTAPRACRKLRPALAPTARARSQPVCTMIHAMIRRVFVRAEANGNAGRSFLRRARGFLHDLRDHERRPLNYYLLPPLPPSQVRCSTEMRFSRRKVCPPPPTRRTQPTALHPTPHPGTCMHARTTHSRKHAQNTRATNLSCTYSRVTHEHTCARAHECTNARTHARTHARMPESITPHART